MQILENKITNAHETLIWATKNNKSKYTFNYQSLKCLNDDLRTIYLELTDL